MIQQKVPLWIEAKAMLRLFPFNRDFGEGKRADFSPDERLAKAEELISFAKAQKEPERSRLLSWLHLDGWLWELKNDTDSGTLPAPIAAKALNLDLEISQLVGQAPYRLR